MEKEIVLQPRFSNGNEVYIKVSIMLDKKTAFTALCNQDAKVSVQKFPTYKTVNIYGTYSNCAIRGLEAISKNWSTLDGEVRKRALMCVNELPRSFQRLCMVMNFTQADMVEVHDYLRFVKAAFVSFREGGVTNENATIPVAIPEGLVDVGDRKDARLTGTSEWRRADMGGMPTEVAQSLLDAFASEPEKAVYYGGDMYRAHEGAIETRPASDTEIAKAKAEAFARQRKTVYMAMFKPGQAFGEFEEGNLYPCNDIGGNYVSLNLSGKDWRKVRGSRLNFYDVYAEAPETANEATATQQS